MSSSGLTAGSASDAVKFNSYAREELLTEMRMRGEQGLSEAGWLELIFEACL